jgi:hypothetical protein
LQWFTFLRSPKERYLSHYLYDRARTNDFSYSRWKSMKTKSILEWEGIQDYRNYQTRFIAGEECLQKAIEILEQKMVWVGITEEFDDGLASLAQHFGWRSIDLSRKPVNKNLSYANKKDAVMTEHGDFIEHMNEIDQKLYEYVCREIWPKLRLETDVEFDNKPKSRLSQELNMLRWQITRQTKFHTEDVNLKNLKRFFRRWY